MLSGEMGRRIVITGANTGIGRATAIGLASSETRLVLACRDVEGGRRVASEIHTRTPRAQVRVVALDLASLSSVERAAYEIAREGAVDILVNNAGVAGARGKTRDGFELAFGVNYVGHYVLTRLLDPTLAPGSRVLHLSSGSHVKATHLDFGAALRPTRTFTGVEEYAVAKLAVMLFHRVLARAPPPLRLSVAVDPGSVASDAWRHVPWPVRSLIKRSLPPPSVGARATLQVIAARASQLEQGGYYAHDRIVTPSSLACDDALATELWMRTARWTGLPEA